VYGIIPLGIWDKLKNKRISRKRSIGKRPYAIVKSIFKSTYPMVMTIARVHAITIFASMGFNITLAVPPNTRALFSGCYIV
jgi:transposase, IS5 family